MNHEKRKQEILAALEYRSGNDSCNSVYAGSMKLAQVISLLGGSYGKDSVEHLLETATCEQIAAAHRSLSFLIGFMHKHPVKKCPTCGNIM